MVIHRAIFGSFERFMALLIEHYAGALPDVAGADAGGGAAAVAIATSTPRRCVATLEAGGPARRRSTTRVEKIGYKIREAQLQKVPTCWCG